MFTRTKAEKQLQSGLRDTNMTYVCLISIPVTRLQLFSSRGSWISWYVHRIRHEVHEYPAMCIVLVLPFGYWAISALQESMSLLTILYILFCIALPFFREMLPLAWAKSARMCPHFWCLILQGPLTSPLLAPIPWGTLMLFPFRIDPLGKPTRWSDDQKHLLLCTCIDDTDGILLTMLSMIWVISTQPKFFETA